MTQTNGKKYAVFTMDVESFADTECVFQSQENLNIDLLDGLDEYVRLLDKHDIKGTFFAVADLVPRISERIKAMVQKGHKLALHSFKHVASVDVDEEEFRSKICEAKNALSRMFDTDVVGFRAPFFSLDNKRLDILRELGFRYDSSNLDFPKARHTVEMDLAEYRPVRAGVLKNRDFYEFSLSNHKIFGASYPVSGGGYVRLCNWPFIKGVIHRHIKENDYYVFYLHPFELTKQKIPTFRNMKLHDRYYLRYGIRTYAKRIEQIIVMLKKAGYSFVTFEELAEIIES